ncbi:rRNA methyltransferase [Dactylosporangium vinaceum]|uniref:Small ribosomal subunit Rsm22 family protein n=1 Tax=Dactylosporangium vinaceum TaxID=53362 RepID=A0ABV5M482_9ACTN|nr:small ribosomal subunit Rsm22 family protein [Dactylosporangium vinaceum]UAB93545.1 rRNA methyltransferase [Dactylosporangium vinaceum]
MPELREALDALLADVPPARLTDSVRRLIEVYRSGLPAGEPLIRNMVDATAYAAYRMPATHAAVVAALATLPAIAPRSHVDLGGGTGAAAWAVQERYGTMPHTVLDQVPEALKLGERIAKQYTWQPWQLGEPVPAADLVTASYVLTELDEEQQHTLVEQAATAAGTAVVLIEPGTPPGYRRILAARDQLLRRGWHIAAPCPHELACGLQGRDWCHFAARVNRSSLHRRLKEASLGYEDEKFSFVAAVPGPAGTRGRIVRHPAFRKGLVTLQVCQPDTTVGPVLVSKREGQVYKAARDAEWGDAWPPPG